MPENTPTNLLLSGLKEIISTIEEYTGANVANFEYEKRLPEAQNTATHYITMKLAWSGRMNMPNMRDETTVSMSIE